MKIIDVVGFIKVNNPGDLELIIPGMIDLLAEQVNEEPTIYINDIATALETSVLNNPGHGYEIKLVNENYRYVFREEDIPYWKTYRYRNMVVMGRAPRALTKQQIDKIDAFCLNWGLYSVKLLDKESPKDNDPVNHPNHYVQNGLESIDVIKAFTSDLNGIEAFCAGNAIKYILRFNHKNGEQDLDKAIWYINKLKEEKYHNKETKEDIHHEKDKV